MAKTGSKKSTKRERKPPAANALKRITIRAVLGDGISKKTARVYGVAKKAISKETSFETVHGIKGVFEVLVDGDIKTSRQAFLGADAQKAIAGKLASVTGTDAQKGVMFGVELTREGDKLTTEFFAEPSQADPLAALRDAARD